MSTNDNNNQEGKPWGLIVISVFFLLALIGPILWQVLSK